MSGRPRVHGSGDNQEDLGFYKLNLSADQLNQVADLLSIERGSDFERQLRSGAGTEAPKDGQQLLLTYKGKYVRLLYADGQPAVIPPGTITED